MTTLTSVCGDRDREDSSSFTSKRAGLLSLPGKYCTWRCEFIVLDDSTVLQICPSGSVKASRSPSPAIHRRRNFVTQVLCTYSTHNTICYTGALCQWSCIQVHYWNICNTLQHGFSILIKPSYFPICSSWRFFEHSSHFVGACTPAYCP